MDKKYDHQTWVGNLFQRIEAVCHEVDELVNKDTVKYVENHIQTVGENVKKFYSGVVQDFIPPLAEHVPHVAELIPSKPINLVETYTSSVVDTKEDTIVDSLFPTEKCQELSTTGLCHSEKIGCEVSAYPVGVADCNSYVQNEGQNLINKTLDNIIQVHLSSSTNSQGNSLVEQFSCKDVSSPECKNSSEAFISRGCADENRFDDHSSKISHESSKNHHDNRASEDNPETSVFEDADWGIEDIIDLDLVIDEVIEGEASEDVNISAHRVLFAVPLVEENSEKVPMETLVSGFEINCPQEKETLLNRPIDEFKSNLNTLSIHQSSELESSITCNENKEERKSHDTLSSSFRNSLADPDVIESMGCFSSSTRSLSSCHPLGAIAHDNNNDSTCLTSSSCTLSDDTIRADDAATETELYSCERGCYNNLPQSNTSLSCSEIGTEGSSMVDDEYFNMDTIDLSDKKQHMDAIDLSNKKQFVESCVIVKGQNIISYPYRSGRSKSYKNIIQDAFMLRKRLSQEYKQLAILYGDIDQDFSELTQENTLPNIGSTPKSPARDLPDTEWELL